MKKILSILIGTFAFSTFSFAQTCNVDSSIVITGFYPDTIQGFKDGYVNTDYEQVVQVRIPTDSTLVWNSIDIKAKVSYGIINSVAGMPSGFMFDCNNSDCKTMGGSKGCGIVYGKPTLADLNKTFKLTFLHLTIAPNELLMIILTVSELIAFISRIKLFKAGLG